MTSFREENGGEQLYSALKALGRLEDDFREMNRPGFAGGCFV
jgi:hypothetical protein